MWTADSCFLSARHDSRKSDVAHPNRGLLVICTYSVSVMCESLPLEHRVIGNLIILLQVTLSFGFITPQYIGKQCYNYSPADKSLSRTFLSIQARINDIYQIASSNHLDDIKSSLETDLIPEDRISTSRKSPLYEWSSKEASIVETMSPILDESSRQVILDAALSYWEAKEDSLDGSSSSTESRFTFQSVNKREVHASDLNTESIHVINNALSQAIYPMLRDAFKYDLETIDSLTLYDSLVIEYDARSLSGSSVDPRDLPSQPLHRDLGLLSVNIALNDPSEFQGGGTVFERLLPKQGNDDEDPTDEQILSKATIVPRAGGHCVAHPCRERHAGGALTSGIRTILVLFFSGLTTTTTRDSNTSHSRSTSCPPLELAARCKGIGMALGNGDGSVSVPACDNRAPLNGPQDRILCYRAAIQADQMDGEAYLFLAMTLLGELDKKGKNASEKLERFAEVVQNLETARELNPADGRIHNTLGIALKKQLEYVLLDGTENLINRDWEEEQQQKIGACFHSACKLHILAAKAGCQGAAMEARASLLNYGLWFANRDDFENAIPVLEQICGSGSVADTSSEAKTSGSATMNAREWQAQRVVDDAKQLLSFCKAKSQQR